MFVYFLDISFFDGKIITVIYMLFERLLDIRIEADLTQEEIAEILKTPQSNYSRWENGKELIPLKKMTELCNYFNLSMDYVIGIKREHNGNGKHLLDSREIGSRLRCFRKKYNITQCQLAKLLHTSQSTISAYESGKTIILTAFALQIVYKYHVSLDWLCGRTQDMYSSEKKGI